MAAMLWMCQDVSCVVWREFGIYVMMKSREDFHFDVCIK